MFWALLLLKERFDIYSMHLNEQINDWISTLMLLHKVVEIT